MTRWLTKKRLFEFHGWLGLTLGLPLFVICFSGTFAVMSPEIDWLLNPAVRVTPPDDPDAQPLSWGTLKQRFERTYPSGTVTSIQASSDPRTAYYASMWFGPRDFRLVYINQYTGDVQGQTTLFNVKSFFRIFHKQFYILRGDYWPHGRVFVCVFSIVLLLSVVTALMFYKRWWRSLWQLRFTHGGRVFCSDLHRMVGVWSLLLAIVFAVTGMWYLTAQLLEEFDLREHDSFAEVSAETRATRPAVLDPVPLDELVANAQTAYPGWQITGVFPSVRPGHGVTLIGDGPAVLTDSISDQVQLDPYTGEVMQVSKAHELTLGPRLIATVDPLHFGRFGGYVTKVLWTVAGLMLSVGILAGVCIWWLRAQRASPGFFKKSRGWTIAALVGNLGLFTFATFATIAFISNQVNGPRQSQPGYALGDAKIGPWRVEAFRHGAAPDQLSDTYTFRFVGDGDPNFKDAHVWIGDTQRPDHIKPVRGTVDTLSAPLSAPHGTSSTNAILHLQIERWDGVVVAADFPLTPVESTPSPRVSAPEPPRVPAGVKAVVAVFFIIMSAPICAWLVCVR